MGLLGTIRVYIDFRDLNYATPKDEYPMSVAEMLVDSAAGFEYLSMLEGYLGYNQIFIAEEYTLKEVNIFTNAQLGTVTGKVVNGITLKHMKLIKKEDYTELSTDLKESAVVSNLMDNFPPICKQDPLDVRVNYILDHYEKTGQTIKLSDIPDTMYGGALPIAKSRKSKKRAISEVE